MTTTRRFVLQQEVASMKRISRNLVVVFGALVLMAALAGNCPAQTVIVGPVPRVSLFAPRTYVSYYEPAPVYYSPAPVVSYYSPPAVSYYTPPTVSYYTPAPVVAAPAAAVTTYRGILPWRTYSVVSYGAAPVVAAPAPVVRYYSPVYYYP
jgi:hypothetical protein